MSRLGAMWSVRTRLVLAVLLLSCLGLGAWQTTHYARTWWWPTNPHVSVGPGDDGFAQIGDLRASIRDIGTLDHAFAEHDQPPAGFVVWFIALEVEPVDADTDIGWCAALVEDSEGMIHHVGNEVPFVPDYSSVAHCALPGPDDFWDPPDPVQRLLVLLPDGHEPRFVRLESSGLMPEFLELPVD